MGDPHQLGILASLRALLCGAGGDPAGARAALEQAETLAVASGTETGSGSGGFLDRARAAVGSLTARDRA